LTVFTGLIRIDEGRFEVSFALKKSTCLTDGHTLNVSFSACHPSYRK
jgi:hypothetical protein